MTKGSVSTAKSPTTSKCNLSNGPFCGYIDNHTSLGEEYGTAIQPGFERTYLDKLDLTHL
jgi:hypothetical protein